MKLDTRTTVLDDDELDDMRAESDAMAEAMYQADEGYYEAPSVPDTSGWAETIEPPAGWSEDNLPEGLINFSKRPWLTEPWINWFVRGWIVRNHINVLFGDSGVAKSTVALYLAHCIATGLPWFEMPVEQGRVLFLDAELDDTITQGRLQALARGMDWTGDRLPDGLAYYRLKNRELIKYKKLEQLKKASGADLVILDSLTFAMVGMDLAGSTDTLDVYQQLRERLGTVLVLDHVAKPKFSADGAQLASSQYGSAFKKAGARSQIKLVRHDKDDSVIMSREKGNFGAVPADIKFHLTFESDQDRDDCPERIKVSIIAPSEDALAILAYLQERPTANSTEDMVQAELGTIAEIEEALTELQAAGKVRSLGRGRWVKIEKITGVDQGIIDLMHEKGRPITISDYQNAAKIKYDVAKQRIYSAAKKQLIYGAGRAQYWLSPDRPDGAISEMPVTNPRDFLKAIRGGLDATE